MNFEKNGKKYINYDLDGLNSLVTNGTLTQAEADQIVADAELKAVLDARQARYKAETDGLYLSAQLSGDAAKLQAWKDAVNQIKLDLPKPV